MQRAGIVRSCYDAFAKNLAEGDGRKRMIRFYFHPTPNPAKVALMLEETGLAYQLVFDSSAILLYLGEKTGRLIGSPSDRPELLSWLFFIATGIGPFSGQAVHFQHAAPEKVSYAVNRYRREIERHYEVLDKHLKGREFIVGKEYSIADISAWGWLDRAPRVLPGDTDPMRAFPNLERWFRAIDSRPAAAKTRAVGKDHAFKKEVDEETRRALFPSNYPKVVS
jgi:GSH-dependent disulfide-bond oxidoreductase